MGVGIHRCYLPSVAALVFTSVHEQHVRGMIRDYAELHVCRSENDLALLTGSHRIDALIASLVGPLGESTLPLLASLRMKLPHVPVIAYIEMEPGDARHLLAAGRSGVSLVLFHGMAESRHLVADILRDAHAHTLAGHLQGALQQVKSEYVVRFCQYCLTHAARPLTVERVAFDIRVTRQHLAREFAAAGLRPPSWYVGVSRILLAAKLLDIQQQPVERVARVLQYPSGTALSQAMRHYTSKSPGELRGCGGFEYVLELVRLSLAAGQNGARLHQSVRSLAPAFLAPDGLRTIPGTFDRPIHACRPADYLSI